MRRSDPDADWRTIIVPVRLEGAQYRLAHEACHKAALIWNGLVGFLRRYWEEHHADPDYTQLRAASAQFEPAILGIHSQSKQAIVDDLLDAVQTYRTNRDSGSLDAKAPWKEKNYRPLTFTARSGWSVTRDSRLALSLGRGRPRLIFPLPVTADQATGEIIPPERWGEARLCWDRNARRFTFNIAVRQYTPRPVLDPQNVMAFDPGIIHPHAFGGYVAPDVIEVTVVNGRRGRAIKHRRNKAVSELDTLMARCTRGSRRWRKLDRAKKKARATAGAQLHDFNHKVSRVVADKMIEHNTGTFFLGDVRGIERKTRAKKRHNKDQRRRLSQWDRGRQEDYIAYKTGVAPTHLNEAHSSQTCLACSARNKPSGRKYRCGSCGFTCHRDVVGLVNILHKGLFGSYNSVHPDTQIRVLYCRPVKVYQPKKKSHGTAGSQPRHTASNQATGGTATRVAVPTAPSPQAPPRHARGVVSAGMHAAAWATALGQKPRP